MSLKVTIITVTYNNPDTLKTCHSITEQTYKNFEWILVDGGSDKEILAPLKKCAGRADIFISEKDSGIYNAMNKAIKLAKGEYLIFMNGGDVFNTPDTLEKAAAYLKGDDVYYGSANFVLDGKIIAQKATPDHISLEYLAQYGICHQSSFIKRELFEKYGLYNEKLKICSDTEKFMLLLKNGCKFTAIPLTVANYDCSGISSVSTQKSLIEKTDVIYRLISPEKAFEFKHMRVDVKKIKFLGLNILKLRYKNGKKTISFLGLPLVVIHDKFYDAPDDHIVRKYLLLGFIPVFKRSVPETLRIK